MAKVIRSEGKYPSGAAQLQWGLIQAYRDIDSLLIRGDQDGLFGRSTDWKRMRMFLQTDLLNPTAADGYLMGVIQAAEVASQGVSAFTAIQDLNSFLNHAAFDMFCTIMFGEMVSTRIHACHFLYNVFVICKYLSSTLLTVLLLISNTVYPNF